MQSFLISQDLGIPTLAPYLDSQGALHGAYTGANDLFHIPGPFYCPGNAPLPLPAGWRTQNIGLSSNTINGVWKDFPAQGFASELLPSVKECNTVYLVTEFWPYSMERARPLLLSSFQRHSLTGMRLRAQLRYDPSVFNVAIHARLGDIRPTPIAYQVATLLAALKRLDPQKSLPIEVWVFSESPHEFVEPLRAAQFDRSVHFDTGNMSALLTLMHLLESNVVIGSDSSFSWFAAYLSQGERPLFLTAPNTREDPSFQNYMTGNVRVSPTSVFEDRGRLAAAAAQWQASRPAALRQCTSNMFWMSLAENSRAVAQIQRLDYIVGYFHKLERLRLAQGHRAFDISPAQPLECAHQLVRYGGRLEGLMAGSGDGGKWLCGVEQTLNQDGCSIFSLGSNGDFSFEELMVNVTRCHVYSFDCTVGAPADIGSSGRIHFQQVCIDGVNSLDGRMKTLSTVATELGLRSIQLLKMDIEGFEHKVLDGFLENFRTNPAFTLFLPGQISLEVHHTDLPWLPQSAQIPMQTLGSAFLALAELGYSLVSREDNPSCPHCSEFTYIRTAC